MFPRPWSALDNSECKRLSLATPLSVQQDLQILIEKKQSVSGNANANEWEENIRCFKFN